MEKDEEMVERLLNPMKCSPGILSPYVEVTCPWE